MSCQVEAFADCGDINRLARALFLPDKDDQNWLSSCLVSVSSCGTILTVAYKNRICICTIQWVPSTESNTYIVTWNGTLEDDITTLFSVPVCSSSHSLQDSPDWICIMIGLKSGAIAFYTNTGHLLLSESLDEKPVLKINCHTGMYGADADDIYVLYPNSICILSGSSLFQTLKYAKAQIARVQASFISEFSLDGKSITFRKWAFVNQDVINDACVVGLELKNTFDHLFSASSYGGYDTWYRSVPPHNTLILGVGARPYLGFHYALEGGTSPPLQDVARAVASKIKSALPGWLGGGNAASKQAPQENKPRSESLAMRSGISDVQRYGSSVVLSPDRRYAAVTDSLGRVAIVDVHRGSIVRLFKGCRDAQCGFVQVFEKDSSRAMSRSTIKEYRRALFLIIYNPKKGVLDIRLMQRGSRVAVFTASKNGKLLYSCNGLVGFESNYTSKKLNLPLYQCVLIDPDGVFKKISIPFHYALEGENSQRSRDLHVLRKMKIFLKCGNFDQDSLELEVIQAAESIQVIELKKHFIDMLIGNIAVSPQLVSTCLDVFLNPLENCDNIPEARKPFLNYLKSLKRLCEFYINVPNIIPKTRKDDSTSDISLHAKVAEEESLAISEHINETPIDSEAEMPDINYSNDIKLSDEEIEILHNLLRLTKCNPNIEVPSKVTFKDCKSTAFKQFINSFEVCNSEDVIILKDTLTHTQLFSIANDCYKTLFDADAMTSAEWADIAKASCIEPKDLMKLLIFYWMEKRLGDINLYNIDKLLQLIYNISLLSKCGRTIEYNEISPWWQEIRSTIAEMPCPFRSMIVAMACRVVCFNIEKQKEPNEEEAWEYVTKENANWSILIGKLEDISILSAVLSFRHSVRGKTIPKLKYPTAEISLKNVYNQGKGFVAEMVAKWLCSFGVLPEAIVSNELLQTPVEPMIINKKSKVIPDEDDIMKPIVEECDQMYIAENEQLFKWLNMLRKQFTYSTTANSLIANMCWEYSVHWQKNIQDMSLLESVILCLNNISDMHLSVGLCSMIWTTHYKQIFESICKLVNKVGKKPKEVLCLQTLGINDKKMLDFLDHLIQFFERYMFFCSIAEQSEKVPLEFEKIWDESLPALVEVAHSHDSVNEQILNWVYQMVCTLFYICKFNVNVNKPLSTLYDCDFQLVLNSMTTKDDIEKILAVNDRKLEEPRKKFLSKVVKEVVELISCVEGDNGELKYQTNDSSHWLEKLECLAEMWNSDKDIIRQEQVISTFKLGYDRLAEDIIPTITEPISLIEPLLDVCGKRLKRYVENCTDVSNSIAALPPELGTHLQTLESDTSIASNISLKSTASVIETALCHAESCKTQAKYQKILKLAECMIYGCDILVELHSLK